MNGNERFDRGNKEVGLQQDLSTSEGKDIVKSLWASLATRHYVGHSFGKDKSLLSN